MMTALKQQTTAFLDRNLKRLISRKFLVFILATVAFWQGSFSQENWLIVSCIYIGLEATVDIVKFTRALKLGGSSREASNQSVEFQSNQKP